MAEELTAPDDPVLVEPSTEGIILLGAQLGGGSAVVVIPWDHAVELSRHILQPARRGDVR